LEAPIGEWWTPMILRDTLMGVTRFEQFQRRLGIARNVLAQRLDALVTRGILEQVKYQERPTRYEYKLTPMGHDLWSVVTLLRQWGDTWLAPDGPPIVSFHTCCGQVAAAELVCSFCREPLRTRSCSCNTAPAHPRDEPSRRRT
jgi:DNA-binding HxlR family transcriptional regulator